MIKLINLLGTIFQCNHDNICVNNNLTNPNMVYLRNNTCSSTGLKQMPQDSDLVWLRV